MVPRSPSSRLSRGPRVTLILVLRRAALLREAVRDLIAKKRQAGMEAAFGLWKDRTDITDGLAYQEMLRAEWPD